MVRESGGGGGWGGKEKDGMGLHLRSCQEAKQVQANNVGGAYALYRSNGGIRGDPCFSLWKNLDGWRQKCDGRSGMRREQTRACCLTQQRRRANEKTASGKKAVADLLVDTRER